MINEFLNIYNKMDETNFANMDDHPVRSQPSPNVYTILESQKRNDYKMPKSQTHQDNYLKKSTAFFIICLSINGAIISCVGCGVLVYLTSNRSTECRLIFPSNMATSEKQVTSLETMNGAIQHEGPLALSIVNQGIYFPTFFLLSQ